MSLLWAAAALKIGLGVAVLGAAGFFSGCASVLPETPQRPAVYDLGALTTVAPAPPPSNAQRLALVLAAVESPGALEGPAMLYRLSHSQMFELKPYALARWAMAPGALVRERAAATLAREHIVLAAGDPLPASAFTLKLELLRFEQTFSSDTNSTAEVGIRATLFGPDGAARGQRSFSRSVDAGANAASGAAGMRNALDLTLLEISAWLRASAQ